MVAPGEHVRVTGFDAGRGLRARLTAIGLAPGTELTVISNKGRGPFIVAVKGTRIMLGRGVAHQIRVA
jgi:Fe2+ transport system protein FeoA